MIIQISPDSRWYHGSNIRFDILREGSTITQWRQLAEAFSHKPTQLSYDDNGCILHNGAEPGYLYAIDEPIQIGKDILPHPRTVMDENVEFITLRPLKVKFLEFC